MEANHPIPASPTPLTPRPLSAPPAPSATHPMPPPPFTPPFSSQQVFLKSLGGKTVTLNLREDATTEELKEEVEKREGVPPQMQQLLWGGKHLQAGRRLRDQGITIGATLHLSLAMKGGMPLKNKVRISNIYIKMNKNIHEYKQG
jgi:hypothetical protein